MIRLFILGLILILTESLHAQMWDHLAVEPYRVDSTQVRALRIKIDNLSFFRDNEYSSKQTKGYSLPGLWIQPKLVYTPIQQIEFELGAHALIFNGANKYPCYVYHDIATWKGQQYQRGAHVLPWVRAKAQFKHLTIVLGNIHGGQHHGLSLPLYHPENNLSQDPEMGFQLLWDRPHLHADTWLNWQSYIFEEDTHQEAFTVGTNWHILYNSPKKKLHWFSPISLVIQHRGGEQDKTNMGVQTLCNGGAGIALRWNTERHALNHITAEAQVLGTYQQSGKLWPFNNGFAYHARTGAKLWDGLEINAGCFAAPRHFVSLYGAPFFSTLSIRDNESHKGITTVYAQAYYHYTFEKSYTLGAEIEAYQSWLGASSIHKTDNELNFSFGIYFRLSPSILLKRF